MPEFAQLSAQEQVVADAVARGASNREVADELHLSPRTVEAHLGRIYRKLGITSRSQLVALAADRWTEFARPDLPETRYAKAGDLSIAYHVFGDGPVDIVLIPGLASHIEMLWELPQWRRFVDRIRQYGRFIVFDKRGTGLSDPMPPRVPPTLEQRMDDVTAVMDAAGSRKALIFGLSEGGPMSLYFAAAHPDRTAALLVYGTTLPSGPRDRPSEDELAKVEAMHGTGHIAGALWPSMAATPDGLRWLGRFERHAASPAMLRSIYESAVMFDPTTVLSAIHVPITVVHGRQDQAAPFEGGEQIMRYLPRAKFVPIDVFDHVPWGDADLEAILRELEALIERGDWTTTSSSVLATLVAVGNVTSTNRIHVEHWMTATGGVVRATDSGNLVGAFAAPSAAVRCARMLQGLGDPLSIGISLGEVTVHPDRIEGEALIEAHRMMTSAEGETFVSAAVVQMAEDAFGTVEARNGYYRLLTMVAD